MKKAFVFLFLLLVSIRPLRAQQAGYPDFEIVESTPIETTLDNPDIRDAHDVWLEMINNAKSTLDIEQFYVSTHLGEPLEDVLQAIVAAGERGVKVRILVDARMYKTYPNEVDALRREKNIATRVINFMKLAGGIQHAKYFIVDGEEIFLGSQNFDWRALKHIHEIGVRIKHHEAATLYQDIFEYDWKFAEANDPKKANGSLQTKHYETPFRIVEGPRDTLTFTPTCSPKGQILDSTLWDEMNMIRLIDGAKSEVDLQFLSYSRTIHGLEMYDTLDNAIRRAAARGANVRLIVSDWSKATPAQKFLKALSTIPNIQVKFSSIPDWSGGYISFARVEHCKFIVVDSVSCWIGTSNAEKSYFYNTRNLGVIVRNPKINSIMKRIFMKSWDSPYTELVKQDVEYKPREHGEK